MVRKILLWCALLIAAPVAVAQGTLSVGFAGTHASMGAFIDVTALQATSITGFQMNLATGAVTVSVYTKAGTTAGFENNAGAWTLHATVSVTGNGQGVATNVSIPPFAMTGGQTTAFLLAVDTNGKMFNDCCGSATSSAADAVLSFVSRYDTHNPFSGSSTYLGWPFQGAVVYGAVIPAAPTDVPTLSEWTLVALMLTIALFAAASLRQRRK
jgi:hypothetical protein